MALQELSNSLTLFGLKQPAVFYTDNMADRQFLMRTFPSLSTNTTPVEKYGHLPVFTIPSNILVRVYNTASTINFAIDTILDDLQDDGENTLVVGFDSEWNVQTGPNDRVVGSSPTAIVQIAYGTQVYILQVSQTSSIYYEYHTNHASKVAALVRGGSLPHKLKILLSNPRVMKVGRAIESDVKMLEQACGPGASFRGIIDLARYAIDRHVIDSSQSVGLNDLCAQVLGKSLRKNLPERVGEGWERESLTEAQIEYAASDAYASLAIYNRLSSIPTPKPILPNAPLPSAGTPVLLFNNGQTVIARAQVIDQPLNAMFDGLSLDARHVVIEVTHTVVPGALVHSHRKASLKSFGSAPFSIVALRRNLRIYHPLSPFPSSEQTSPLLFPPADLSQSSPGPSSMAVDAPNPTITPPQDLDDTTPFLPNAPLEPSSIAALVFDLTDPPAPPQTRPQDFNSAEVDNGSRIEGIEILGPIPAKWKSEIVSRVLKDPFHIFNMFYISATHGLRVDFAQALRDALFIPDPEDVGRINAWGRLQDPPTSFEELRKYRARWVWQRCKRVIPPVEQLYPAVRQVFQTWGPLKDAESGTPLFNKAAWKTAKQILDLVTNGFVSDPPGVALYSLIGIGKDTGLPIYRCFRGTTATEGGVHTHLRSHLPSSGTSIRHALACLKDFVLHRNLVVSVLICSPCTSSSLTINLIGWNKEYNRSTLHQPLLDLDHKRNTAILHRAQGHAYPSKSRARWLAQHRLLPACKGGHRCPPHSHGDPALEWTLQVRRECRTWGPE
jgi:3'-5' exonuclease